MSGQGRAVGTDTARALVAHPAMFTELRFSCPLPTSTNQLYFNVAGRGRVLSDSYKAWRREAALCCAWLRWPDDNKARWELDIALYAFPFTRDVSNTIKAVEDLVAAMTGLADRYDDKVTAYRMKGHPGPPRATVTVRVWGWGIVEEERR